MSIDHENFADQLAGTDLSASCHCGQVSIKLDRLPDYINYCNCSLCRSTGSKWGYFKRFEVTIEGPRNIYIRSDKNPAKIETHFCTKCGSTTNWDSIEERPLGNNSDYRFGVNMALFESRLLIGIEIRHFNGQTWEGEWRPSRRLTKDDQF